MTSREASRRRRQRRTTSQIEELCEPLHRFLCDNRRLGEGDETRGSTKKFTRKSDRVRSGVSTRGGVGSWGAKSCPAYLGRARWGRVRQFLEVGGI